MNKLFLRGILATALYLFGVCFYIFVGWAAFKEMEPNAWGDFLAGFFGPLALLWIVLSFYVQSKELQASVKSLDVQTKELQQSVEAQKKLAESSSEQVLFSTQTRNADLWLEARKAELETRKNLAQIAASHPIALTSRHGTLAASGMFHSGARESFDQEMREIESEAKSISATLDQSFPTNHPSADAFPVVLAGLAYDLKINSGLLVARLDSFLREDQQANAERLQDERNLLRKL